MKVGIEFNTDTAGFRHDDGTLDTYAVSSVLIDIAEQVRAGTTRGLILDPNGNSVGDWGAE